MHESSRRRLKLNRSLLLLFLLEVKITRDIALFFSVQGNVLQNNPKNNMLVQQNSVALQKVKRSQAGNYTCIASNVEGDGFSNSVELKIMCEYSNGIFDNLLY